MTPQDPLAWWCCLETQEQPVGLKDCAQDLRSVGMGVEARLQLISWLLEILF